MGIPHHPMKRFLMKIAAIGRVEEIVDWISAPSALGAGAWYGTTSARRKWSSQHDVNGTGWTLIVVFLTQICPAHILFGRHFGLRVWAWVVRTDIRCFLAGRD